ncbi:TPA: hypothetical protein ACTW34_000658 [Raoultella planticola]
MSILFAHQLSSVAQAALKKGRRVRIAKAELALIRIQSILGLNDEELLNAVKRVTDVDAITVMAAPPKER